MSDEEYINSVLRQYKDAVKSYSFENRYMNKIEDNFEQRLMTDATSSLYDAVNSLFVELTLSRALRYISIWSRQYIIQSECCDPDIIKYNRLQAIGQTFINECKRIAADVCELQEEQPQGGGGVDHPKKVQQKMTQIDNNGVEEQPEPQQGGLEYYCQKALDKGYLEKTKTGYKRLRWSKAQLAYFLQNFPNDDGTFKDKEYSLLFGESRLGKARAQLADNKTGNGKPRGFEIIDELLKE